ncbi:MAG: hypothetical protein UU13_C0005G0001 [Candidatus Nomurabacteria bacterium GW2011_GWB1_40_7]|uniref:Uncharacterized protein n=1 Tax=Candidatus Nomurabacteria bacterium GW2011_GWB1_40_7 TaxID=1618744 RepID=A0A0G0VEF4_9BACT|nr:MAG: hypothetical protein UU13_C0005G0001 [Candidatus Nomurabacteria bacterium GW2011_GWB1_40_7]
MVFFIEKTISKRVMVYLFHSPFNNLLINNNKWKAISSQCDFIYFDSLLLRAFSQFSEAAVKLLAAANEMGPPGFAPGSPPPHDGRLTRLPHGPIIKEYSIHLKILLYKYIAKAFNLRKSLCIS